MRVWRPSIDYWSSTGHRSPPEPTLQVDHLCWTTNTVASNYGDSRTQDDQLVSILTTSPPLSLTILPAYASIVRRFPPNYVHSTDFSHQTEITLQEVPNWRHKLELFIGNRQIELQTKDNLIWTLAQRPYVHSSALLTLTEARAYVELSLRHPRCSWRSKPRGATYCWRRRNRPVN